MSEKITVNQPETVVVQSYPPETVSVDSIETVVARTPESTVVVTGVLAPPSSSTISGSGDVDLTQLADGATLVYQQNTAKWRATRELDNQVVDGGFF